MRFEVFGLVGARQIVCVCVGTMVARQEGLGMSIDWLRGLGNIGKVDPKPKLSDQALIKAGMGVFLPFPLSPVPGSSSSSVRTWDVESWTNHQDCPATSSATSSAAVALPHIASALLLLLAVALPLCSSMFASLFPLTALAHLSRGGDRYITFMRGCMEWQIFP